jgi:hypothetical protein
MFGIENKYVRLAVDEKGRLSRLSLKFMRSDHGL